MKVENYEKTMKTIFGMHPRELVGKRIRHIKHQIYVSILAAYKLFDEDDNSWVFLIPEVSFDIHAAHYTRVMQMTEHLLTARWMLDEV